MELTRTKRLVILLGIMLVFAAGASALIMAEPEAGVSLQILSGSCGGISALVGIFFLAKLAVYAGILDDEEWLEAGVEVAGGAFVGAFLALVVPAFYALGALRDSLERRNVNVPKLVLTAQLLFLFAAGAGLFVLANPGAAAADKMISGFASGVGTFLGTFILAKLAAFIGIADAGYWLEDLSETFGY